MELKRELTEKMSIAKKVSRTLCNYFYLTLFARNNSATCSFRHAGKFRSKLKMLFASI